MSATLAVWFAIALAIVLLAMCALFEIDQRVWRRCDNCGGDTFHEWDECRVCQNCGVPW